MNTPASLATPKFSNYKLCLRLCFAHAIAVNAWLFYGLATFSQNNPGTEGSGSSLLALWLALTYAWLIWLPVLPVMARAEGRKASKSAGPLFFAFLIWLVAGTAPAWVFFLLLVAMGSHC